MLGAYRLMIGHKSHDKPEPVETEILVFKYVRRQSGCQLCNDLVTKIEQKSNTDVSPSEEEEPSQSSHHRTLTHA